MNIRRIIDKNRKLIWYSVLVILFAFMIIKFLNSYYENDEKNKKAEIVENVANAKDTIITEEDYKTESDSIELTMASFVGYCNNRKIKNAYEMLTDECKKAMFPTIEDFEKIYINNMYNVKREYEMLKWATDGDRITYQVTLYADILSTGGTNNSTQEICTFIKDDKGNYKLNVNNYIYGEDINIKNTAQNITVDVSHIDVYEEYEEITITITNNTSKKISLTGNKYRNNIYLENTKGTTYSSLNSEFNSEEIVLDPNTSKTFIVKFNKSYNVNVKAQYLVFSDVILDYEDYLNSDDKVNYKNRTSIKIKY